VLRVEPEIRRAYVADGRVSLAFHPMLDHGDTSRLAHRTAECAAAQDPSTFWIMHDLLFERQNEIWQAGPALMVNWAIEIGLDGSTMGACLDDPAIAGKVARLDQARRDAGIRARPSFDLNGRLIQGALPYEQFTLLFEDILSQ
jgi:protein-disulfide isomerase